MSNNVTYADVALINEGGRLYAGVELFRRLIAEDGRPHYEAYHVLSWVGDIRTPSIRQAIPVVLVEATKYIDQAHDVVIFRGFSKAFQRSTAIESEVKLARKLTVKAVYVPYRLFVRNHGQHTLLLANDAMRRGYSLDATV